MQNATLSMNQTLPPQTANGRAGGAANPNSPDGAGRADDDWEMTDQRLMDQLAKAQMDADKFTKNDQSIKRKDTVEVVVDIINRVKAIAEEVNKMQ